MVGPMKGTSGPDGNRTRRRSIAKRTSPARFDSEPLAEVLFVDLTGIEPVTSSLRTRRATDCATGPHRSGSWASSCLAQLVLDGLRCDEHSDDHDGANRQGPAGAVDDCDSGGSRSDEGCRHGTNPLSDFVPHALIVAEVWVDPLTALRFRRRFAWLPSLGHAYGSSRVGGVPAAEGSASRSCVPDTGLEPARAEAHWHLKPARLPFRHPGRCRWRACIDASGRCQRGMRGSVTLRAERGAL